MGPLTDHDIEEQINALVIEDYAELDSDVALAAFRELLERRRTPPEREVVMEAALRDCRSALAEQIEADLDFCCPKLPDGSPDEDEMDEESRPMIEATKALVAKIDSALSEGENKVVIAKTEDGVVEDKDEIEITEEMIEAGIRADELYDNGDPFSWRVAAIYAAVERVRRAKAIEAYERARGATGTQAPGGT